MTQDRLKQLLDYDPDTGIFVRKTNHVRNVKAWSIAGWSNGKKQGYLRVGLNTKRYMLHRLAWLYVYGKWPIHLDHINGIRNDNRIANLREADKSQNQANSKVRRNGLKGAFRNGRGWQSTITFKGQPIYLGQFKTEREAHDAYCAAAKQHFGEYARFN